MEKHKHKGCKRLTQSSNPPKYIYIFIAQDLKLHSLDSETHGVDIQHCKEWGHYYGIIQVVHHNNLPSQNN